MKQLRQTLIGLLAAFCATEPGVWAEAKPRYAALVGGSLSAVSADIRGAVMAIAAANDPPRPLFGRWAALFASSEIDRRAGEVLPLLIEARVQHCVPKRFFYPLEFCGWYQPEAPKPKLTHGLCTHHHTRTALPHSNTPASSATGLCGNLKPFVREQILCSICDRFCLPLKPQPTQGCEEVNTGVGGVMRWDPVRCGIFL